MKILHVINNLSGGGAEKLLVDVCLQMQKEGHELEVLVLFADKGVHAEKLQSNDVKVSTLNCSKYSLSAAGKIAKFINNGRFSVVHAHLFPTQYYVAMARGNVKPEVKFFTTEHSTNDRRKGKWFFRTIEPVIYNKFDAVVCVSPASAAVMKEHLGAAFKPPIIAIPNGVDIEGIASARKSDDKLFSTGCKSILQVGRLETVKRQDLSIRAIAHIKDVQLLLVGVGELHDKYVELAQQLKLKDKVHFLGFRKDVPELMKAADLLVMPSDWEGMSIAAIEGMASGTPMLATNVNGLKEVVGGAGLLVEKDNADDLAEKMKLVLYDNKLSAELSAKGRARGQEFSIVKMVDKYLDAYKKALKG